MININQPEKVHMTYLSSPTSKICVISGHSDLKAYVIDLEYPDASIFVESDYLMATCRNVLYTGGFENTRKYAYMDVFKFLLGYCLYYDIRVLPFKSTGVQSETASYSWEDILTPAILHSIVNHSRTQVAEYSSTQFSVFIEDLANILDSSI